MRYTTLSSWLDSVARGSINLGLAGLLTENGTSADEPALSRVPPCALALFRTTVRSKDCFVGSAEKGSGVLLQNTRVCATRCSYEPVLLREATCIAMEVALASTSRSHQGFRKPPSRLARRARLQMDSETSPICFAA